MSPTNDKDSTNTKEFNKQIQYINDSTTLLSNQKFSYNPMVKTGVYNQQIAIRYKHPYTMFILLHKIIY